MRTSLGWSNGRKLALIVWELVAICGKGTLLCIRQCVAWTVLWISAFWLPPSFAGSFEYTCWKSTQYWWKIICILYLDVFFKTFLPKSTLYLASMHLLLRRRQTLSLSIGPTCKAMNRLISANNYDVMSAMQIVYRFKIISRKTALS